jgi:hypothetical protein
MSAYDNAKAFFEACEAPKGWAGCQQYVADGATFSAQCEPIAEMTTIEEYADWMYGFGTVTAPEAKYELHASAFDEANNTAIFFATYHAKHTGEGGPVPPTGKETHSQYVYAVTMDDAGKVSRMTKIWNPTWALSELGWT